MLAYSHRMQKLAAEKSDQTYTKKFMARAKADIPRELKVLVTDAFSRHTPDDPTEGSISRIKEGQHIPSTIPDVASDGPCDSLDIVGRLSIDSGISVESNSINTDTILDSHDFSDSCCSDSESIGSWSCLSTKSENYYSISKTSSKSDDCAASDSEALSSDHMTRKPKRYRRKWRIGQENPLLPTVLDNEPVDEERSPSHFNAASTSFSIEPFPLDPLDTRDDSPEFAHSNVSGPISSLEYRTWRVKSTSEEGKVSLKPKPVQSPSVTTIRLRQPRKKQKQDSKSNNHCFRYSEQIDETPGKLGERSGEDHLSLPRVDTSGRHGSLMNTIKEMSSELETEDSVTVSPFAVIDAFSHVEVISERGERVLKSVLKSACPLNLHKRKRVHFFLPDIFKK